MPAESDLTKDIPNESISQFYWVLFIGVSILAGIVVVLDIYLLTVNTNAGLSMLIRSVPVLVIAVTNMLFMHVLSARALK
jgi:magnesium-transporting ATPase (P-type)|uniref:Uncharacterized protein n=1 Tax=viral metagenome TaxID=1070528 RepID=A0A6C0F2C7_9ZZZZ